MNYRLTYLYLVSHPHPPSCLGCQVLQQICERHRILTFKPAAHKVAHAIAQGALELTFEVSLVVECVLQGFVRDLLPLRQHKRHCQQQYTQLHKYRTMM